MVKASKTSVPDANSVYDAAGLRVAERVNDIWRFLVYDIGGKLVAEYGGPQQTDDGGVKYVLSDWQGSTRAIVGNTGHVQSRMDYSTFGESIGTGTGVRTAQQGFSVSDSLRQRYGLTERDSASGLDHTWFRKHENQAGRWTGADPYTGSAKLGNPQSFNRYSYVENQPTNFIDPSGLQRRLISYSCWCRNGNVPGWTDPNPECETCWAWIDDGTGHGGGVSPIDHGGGGGGGVDLGALNRGIQSCALPSGLEHVSGANWWKGKNGKWYRGMSGRGPNQYTGPRRGAPTTKTGFKVLGIIGFVASTGVTLYQVERGEVSYAKGAADIAFGIIGTFGGPPGFVIGAVYFAVDATIGWERVFDVGLTSPRNGRSISTNTCHGPQ